VNTNSTVQTPEQLRNTNSKLGDDCLSASETALTLLKQYSREKPEVVTLWAFGIGFVLGWKLKPW